MAPLATFDLLVVGEINPDVIVSDPDPVPRFGQAERRVATIAMTAGSSSAITAMAAAKLGLRTAFVGLVGDDPFGRFMLGELQGAGVDVGACRTVAGERTGATVILAGDVDRAILTDVGLMAALSADDVPRELVRRSRHLHVGSWFLQDALRPGLPALFEEARAGGTSTSLDPNWDPTERWSGLDDVLAVTDVLLPNEGELRALAGQSELTAAAEALRARGPASMVVAVKQGAAGGLAVGPDGVRSAVPAPAEPVDTIGAGDAFDAGFITGRLAGWTMIRSLALAVACGSLSTRARGGVAGQPSLAEALRIVDAASAADAPPAARGDR